MLTERFFPVIPAKAGTQSLAGTAWIPAFAGMTNFRWLNSYDNVRSDAHIAPILVIGPWTLVILYDSHPH